MRREERRPLKYIKRRTLTALLCSFLAMILSLSHSLQPTAALLLVRHQSSRTLASYVRRPFLSSPRWEPVVGNLPNAKQHQRSPRWRVSMSLSLSSTISHAEEFSNTTTTSTESVTPPLSSTQQESAHSPEYIQELTESWREHPDMNPTLAFPSWAVPVAGKSIQTMINDPMLQPYLASRFETVQSIHPRFKLVRDYNGGDDRTNDKDNTNDSTATPTRQKLILLHPSTPAVSKLPRNVQDILKKCHASDGPIQSMDFSYQQFTAGHVLSRLLPETLHPPPTAFETIGHVAHLNLKSHHLPYKTLIGQVLLETLPSIETVIQKLGEVHGPYRTYDFEVLAGKPTTAVDLTEFGIQLQFDIAKVYWCSRLSEERQRLIRSEFRKEQIVADAFCGIGALCLLAAQQLNCTIWANDWNPTAIDYLKENAARNSLSDKMGRVQSGDAYDFLTDIGLENARDGVSRLPDHVVLNFPLESPSFLGALRWWPVPKIRAKRKVTEREVAKDPDAGAIVPRVHVYTFARADPETDRSAEEVAVDLVASNLLPMGDGVKRRSELNEEYDCRVKTHAVRDVAPGKLVMCVSFSATPKLLRYMQGDFR